MKDNENTGGINEAQERQADNHSAMETGIESTKDAANDAGEAEVADLQKELDELKDKYLRQIADFDNFRKRTAKEKLELIQIAGKDVISSLLTVLDDCARAEEQMKTADDVAAIREGTMLVFSKLRSVLQAKGLRPMVSIGTDFNPEFHEAISEVPAPTPDLAGKVVDEVECGYYLNDKIIRFAKVVVGK